MAVAFDAVGPAGGAGQTSATPTSWTHICGAGATDLLVGIATLGDPSTTTYTVTYNGVSMTSLGKIGDNNSTSGFIWVWGLSSPTTGSNTVLVTRTSGGASANVCGSISYTGSAGTAHLTTAFGFSTTPSVTVTSATGNMVAAFMSSQAGTAFTATSQTLRYRANSGESTQAADAAGAASVTVTGTVANDWWGIVGVDVVASGGAPTIPPIIVMPPRRP